mmetsp:Transcript_20916/g.43653  ORF Transcript_20916/g.43653 Transcript_20916/m.43653 type:complete len:1063 (+) Transcript_20916:197-3385(+)
METGHTNDDEYAAENQTPMSSADFMKLLKSEPLSPMHPALPRQDTPHPLSVPFSPEAEKVKESASNTVNLPSPFNMGYTSSKSTQPPQRNYNRQPNDVASPSTTLPTSSASSSEETPRLSKKKQEPPSPFAKLSVDDTPKYGYETDDSVHYDINDLVFTPENDTNEGENTKEEDKDKEEEKKENETGIEKEVAASESSESNESNEEEQQNETLPSEPTSITYEPPKANKTTWGTLRLISLLMRPFKEKVKARERAVSNGSSSSNLSVLEEESGTPRAMGGRLSVTLDGFKQSIPGMKKRRNSLLEIAKEVKNKKKQDLEFEELQNSVGQFRNPMFEARLGDGNSNRLKNGIYKAKTRLRRNSVIPEDVMKITKEKSLDQNNNVFKQVTIKPSSREKPTNFREWVLDSDSSLYQRHYVFIISLILAEACLLPFQFVFYEKGGNEPAPYGYKVFHFLVTMFYVIDFYISFHLTYVDKKSEVVVDLSMIKDNYYKSVDFKLDIVSAIPFDFFALFTEVWWWASYIKLFKFFRLLNMKKLKRMSDNQTVINIGRILSVLVFYFVVMHILACMWYQLSFYEEKHLHDNHSWMRNRLENIILAQSRHEFINDDGDEDVNKTYSKPIMELATLEYYTCTDLDSNKGIKLVSNNECFTQFRQYLLSLYTVMMIFVQDGVEPTTELECLFAFFCGIFGMVFGAVLVGQTADIIGNLHRSETRYRNKLDDVTEQLKNLEISGPTRQRVFEYLDFIWTVNKGLNRERILGELSDNLKSEVLVSVHGEVIKKIPFFDIDQIPEILVHVVQLLKSSYYLPGDVIVHEHEKTVDTSCMYFIVHGNVAAYHMRNPGTILHLMTKGDFFGEIAYLARGARRTASICAASNSDIASLKFSDVDKLIHLFPEMKAKMETELKKHMAFTEEGRKYIKAATKMEKVQVGSILMHETRGEGIVIKIDNHKRRHVQYKNGEIHKYLPTSWHKIKLLKEGKGTLGKNIWDKVDDRPSTIKEMDSNGSGTDKEDSTSSSALKKTPRGQLVMNFAKKMLRSRGEKKKQNSQTAPSPFNPGKKKRKKK